MKNIIDEFLNRDDEAELNKVVKLTKDLYTQGFNAYTYNSLAELCEEWEDYEEPKSFYAISLYPVKVIRLNTEIYKKDYSQIGNVFETEEEAELAVRKLQAWKRLKDKRFKFDSTPCCSGLCGNGFEIHFSAIMPPEFWKDNDVKEDLILLFGGEE